ncbi:MAG: hypothetical protein OSB09_09465 [Planctomycetota bacterium]|nr:hypothetical protein [Planctomycetota bacterium]
MENGIFLEPEVEQLLGQFELLEIFTDDATSAVEEGYRSKQIEYSGYYANPTYIVLDSADQLEVTRGSFTNSADEFAEFLRDGLLDRPAFESRLQIDGLTIVENGTEVTVLTRQQPWNYGGQQAAEYRQQGVEQLDSRFSASTSFRVAERLEEGEYIFRLRFVGGIYRGDERIRTFSLPIKLALQVKARS